MKLFSNKSQSRRLLVYAPREVAVVISHVVQTRRQEMRAQLPYLSRVHCNVRLIVRYVI